MNVVVVEDEGITAFFLKNVISDTQHKVVGVFDNGNSVLSFLKDNSVDLIFMDINIKGALDGIQTAQKAYIKYPNISFVFLTSYKDSDTISEAQIVKPLGYLVKPVTQSDIEAVLMVVEGRRNTINNSNSDEIICQNFRYNLKAKVLYQNEKVINLSSNEQACLDMLVNNKNHYISTKKLINNIWKDDKNRENSLRELIYRIRKKLSCITLCNTPNIGYMLNI
jgi:two-component SAPR family response regulator